MADGAEAFPPAGEPSSSQPVRRIGVLAIQGDFEAHKRMVGQLGAEAIEIRRPDQLAQVDALIVPGGESTTMEKGIAAYGFEAPIKAFAGSGKPLFGTCAGLILLDREHLGLMDIEVERNAYGRQIKSFEAPVTVRGLGDEPLDAVFIRAPRIREYGQSVEVLAELDGAAVVAKQDNLLVASFHPELTDDARMHALFCGLVDAYLRSAGESDREAKL